MRAFTLLIAGLCLLACTPTITRAHIDLAAEVSRQLIAEGRP